MLHTIMALKEFCWFLNVIVLIMAKESYIELYDGVNYSGDKYVLNETTDDLGVTFNGVFNDKTSSFKVSNPRIIRNNQSSL